MTDPAEPASPEPQRLAQWMAQVLKEREKALADPNPDAVHDLRVAIRRCRSLAEGMRLLDPDGDWQPMRRTGKKLFEPLGLLRDIHVSMEWVEKLSEPDDAVRLALLEVLRAREAGAVEQAHDAMQGFAVGKWQKWARSLPPRAQRLPADSLAFEHVALERWLEGFALHETAMQGRTADSYHRLRVGVKRFRYTVENFLPSRYALWEKDLKKLQDLLGEVHDLDVLEAILAEAGPAFDAEAEARWRTAIIDARRKRLAAYERKAIGENSVWQTWREGLPNRARLAKAAMAKLEARASFHDDDFPATLRIADRALDLYAVVRKAGLAPAYNASAARRLLHAAALFRATGRRKKGWKAVAEMAPPIGWTPRQLLMTALILRQRHEEPGAGEKPLRPLSEPQREIVHFLAGILHTADQPQTASPQSHEDTKDHKEEQEEERLTTEAHRGAPRTHKGRARQERKH